MKLKKYLCLIITFVLLFNLSSCAENSNVEENSQQTTTVEPTDEEENTAVEETIEEDLTAEDFYGLTILVNRTETLNPLLITNESLCKTLNLVYKNIVSYTEDNKISLNLLESYEYNPENNSFLITVKSGIKWDDGTAVSADDFIYSFNTLRSASADVYYKNVIKDVTSFTKQSPNTIKVTVSNPNAGNPYFLAFPVIPVHKKNDKPLTDEVHLSTVVGNGTYKNVSNSINNTIYLQDSTTDSEEPTIKNIRLVISDTDESRFYGFEQELSNVLTSPVSKWSKYHTNKSVNINSYNNMEMVVLGFNFNTPIVNDINFRQAVYYSIPFEQIRDSIYLGFCGDSRTLYPKNHFAYNKNIQNEEFDSLKADEFIKKTGYGGTPLKIITLEQDKELKKTVEIIKSNLEIINVKVEVYPLSFEDYKKAMASKDYDIYVGNYKMSVLPDYTKILGKGNYSGYSNEGLVGLLDKLKVAKSYEEYQNYANSIQSIVFSEKCIIPIIHNNDAIITSADYVSKKPESYDSPYQNVSEWVKETK